MKAVHNGMKHSGG